MKTTRFSALMLGADDSPKSQAPHVHPFVADGEVKVGDVVVITTAGVAIDDSAATHDLIAGVVVGFKDGSGFHVISQDADIGYVLGSGTVVLVAVSGSIAKCVAADAITVGETVVPDDSTAGRIKEGTTARTVVGRALTAAGTAGDIIPVLLGA
jgi:hypothetical protein